MTPQAHSTQGQEPACEVCGARGRTVIETAQAQGGLLFPLRKKGGGEEETAKETHTVLLLPSAEDSSAAGQLSSFSEVTRGWSVYTQSTSFSFLQNKIPSFATIKPFL